MYRCDMARYLNHVSRHRAGAIMGAAPQGQRRTEGVADMADQTPNRLPRKIGQFGLAMAAATAVIAGLASPAYANFPHFRNASVSLASGASAAVDVSASTDSISVQLPNLLFDWTEVGVGNANVVYRLETVVTVTFGCVNGGANNPKASNKTTVTEPLGTSVERTADDNGRITDSVVLVTGSASSPTEFSCPPGQTGVALSATFTNNTITDTTNGVTATDADISVTF
jgi:hypothetical protein